jgi:hypothetical protein
MASAHRFVTQWSPDYFRKWARSIHSHTEQLVIDILEKKKYPEQAYRSCMGVLKLKDRYGKQRLIDACSRALEYGVCSYKMVESILVRGLDQMDAGQEEENMPDHDNIRGNSYYK